MAKHIGQEFYMYFNAGSYASPTWTLVENCRDLDWPAEAAGVDMSTRLSAYEKQQAGMLSCPINWQMLHDQSDTDFTTIQTAFLARTTKEFAIADGPIATTGTAYFRTALAAITKFSRSEPLKDAVTVDVSIFPAPDTNAPALTVV